MVQVSWLGDRCKYFDGVATSTMVSVNVDFDDCGIRLATWALLGLWMATSARLNL